MEPEVLLKDDEVERVIHRIAHEITEKAGSVEDLALLGIRSRGAYLGQRIARKIEAATGALPRFAQIDVTSYRDDTAGKIEPDRTDLSITVDDKTVVLIDDVINTGRTVRAALELVTLLGKPRKVVVAVFIDRGRRELPIRADIVGKNIQVADSKRINVLLKECDGVDRVVVTAKQRNGSSSPVS